jgi:hypothetical protein
MEAVIEDGLAAGALDFRGSPSFDDEIRSGSVFLMDSSLSF